VNTSGLVDGISWETDKPLEVTGTKSDGISTLYVLEPFINQEQK
jgi:hypothetical protein